jgi:hypothetical protein
MLNTDKRRSKFIYKDHYRKKNILYGEFNLSGDITENHLKIFLPIEKRMTEFIG